MSTHKPLLITLSVAATLAAAAPASADLQPVADGARDVDTLGDHVVWVTPARGSARSQIVLDGRRRAAMAGGSEPDLGTDARGRPVVVFIRGDDVWVFDPGTSRARRLAASDRRLDERHPTVSRGRAAWVQRYRSRGRSRERLAFATLRARRPTRRSVPGGGTTRRVEALELSGRVYALSTSRRSLRRSDETGAVRVLLVRPGRKPRTVLSGVNSVNQVTSFHGLALTSTWAYVAERHTDETGTTTVIRRGASGRRAQRLTLGTEFSGEENAPRRRVDSVGATRGGALLLGTSGSGGDLIERESAPRWR